MGKALIKQEVRDSFKKMLANLAPKISVILKNKQLNIDGHDFIRVAALAASRLPRLYECTPQSVSLALIECAELGLIPGGPAQEAHLVPFRNNKINKTEAVLIVGYRGLIKLVTQHGAVKKVEAHVVHARDDFTVQLGTDPLIHHIPYPWNQTSEVERDGSGDPGPVVAAYAVATLADGTTQFYPMTRRELDRSKKRSRAADDGPWVTDTEAMQRRCPVRPLCDKWLPRTSRLVRALDIENQAESGELPIDTDFELAGEPETQTDKVKTALGVPKKDKSKKEAGTEALDARTETGEPESQAEPSTPPAGKKGAEEGSVEPPQEAPPTPPADDSGLPVGHDQVVRIQSLQAKCKMTDEKLSDFLWTYWGKKTVEDMDNETADEVIEKLQHRAADLAAAEEG